MSHAAYTVWVCCLHHALRFPLRTFQQPCASSIDSLIRVSRRAESGTAAPSSTADWHTHCLGRPQPPKSTIRRVQTQRTTNATKARHGHWHVRRHTRLLLHYAVGSVLGCHSVGHLPPERNHPCPQRSLRHIALPLVITDSSDPDRRIATSSCYESSHSWDVGLRSQHRVGPRSLGMVNLPQGWRIPGQQPEIHLPSGKLEEGLQLRTTASLTTVPAKASGTV